MATTRVEAPTEGRNPRTLDIDTRSTLEVLQLINAEDARVAPAVAATLPVLAEAVDATVERFREGGRIHYFGAGSSGRIGVLDAAELPPTFAADPDRIRAHHAGGGGAVERARESAEDDAALGATEATDLAGGDIAVGLTASGRTPYVRGALEAATGSGALRILVTANPTAPLARLADFHIGVDTGPEAIAGSTRMKAATAQKLVLNAFSTAVMVRLGKTYTNLMVEVVASNEKLRGRGVTMLMQATGATEERCAGALADAGGDVKTALVCLMSDAGTDAARAALARAGGVVRTALELLQASRSADEG